MIVFRFHRFYETWNRGIITYTSCYNTAMAGKPHSSAVKLWMVGRPSTYDAWPGLCLAILMLDKRASKHPLGCENLVLNRPLAC